MPPREAINPFPDQYLTLDYDASAPALPHDPTPVPTNDAATTDDQFDLPPTDIDTANFGSPSGDNDSQGGQGSTSIHIDPPPPTTRVDPLSIDPTSSDPSLLAQFTADNDLQHGSGSGGGGLGQTPSASTLFSLRRRFTSDENRPPPHTISPPPLTESSVSSPGGYTTSSVASFDFFSASEGTPTPSYPRGTSVLDQALSDDDESSVPDLDITNDSTVSHITQSPSTDSSFSFSGYDTENALSLTFSPSTTVSDLKYFTKQGCIIPLISALSALPLKTLGCRMLADYAKMPN